MQPTSANQSDFESRIDPAVEELNRIVEQAEQLLRQVGEESGEAEQVAEDMAQRADHYVRSNPWQSVAIAALLGSAITLLITRFGRK
jgi:ElaB/YqjD/DUF883 family membrane-anchored ribosome-binding protein